MGEVLYEKRGKIATVTINRAERRNALTTQVINMLRASLARANSDSDVHVIVLTGAGHSVFCAGGDLGRDSADTGVLARYTANRELVDLFLDIRHLRKPILARVNGHALGLGFAILLACDLTVCVKDARMGCPEMKVGVFPMLTLAHLRRHVGPKKAMEILMTTHQITATEALHMGMLNAVAPPDELDRKVEELVGNIATFSPAAVRLGRDAFHATEDLGFEETCQYLLAQLTLNLQTEDAKEGAQAFLQKRKALWTGR